MSTPAVTTAPSKNATTRYFLFMSAYTVRPAERSGEPLHEIEMYPSAKPPSDEL